MCSMAYLKRATCGVIDGACLEVALLYESRRQWSWSIQLVFGLVRTGVVKVFFLETRASLPASVKHLYEGTL